MKISYLGYGIRIGFVCSDKVAKKALLQAKKETGENSGGKVGERMAS